MRLIQQLTKKIRQFHPLNQQAILKSSINFSKETSERFIKALAQVLPKN